MNAFIIHGTGGSPEGNWFPWLKERLESIGVTTYVPRFPLNEEQSLTNWMNEFDKYREYLNEDSIIIGHSLGPGFILNILENIDFKIRAAFLVSPFLGAVNNEYYDARNKTFVIDKDFDFEKIKKHCSKFYTYHGNDDPYVPLAKAEYVTEKLGAQFKVIEGGGHLNAEFNYFQFEVLYEDIKETVK